MKTNEFRPIDANALKTSFEEDGHLSTYIEEFIDNAPTIDAEPVRHGRWIMDDIGRHRCSICSERLPFIHCYSEETYDEWYEEIEETLYCSHCGAKMDGGKDDENS